MYTAAVSLEKNKKIKTERLKIGGIKRAWNQFKRQLLQLRARSVDECYHILKSPQTEKNLPFGLVLDNRSYKLEERLKTHPLQMWVFQVCNHEILLPILSGVLSKASSP